MNSTALAAILQLVAVALLFAEIFLPSGGILGISTIGVLVASLWVGFSASTGLGWALGAVDLVAFPLLLRWGIGQVARSPMALHDRLEHGSASPAIPDLAGKEGISPTGLRPVGEVLVEGIRLEAVSTGAFVEPGGRVVVSGSDAGRLLVRPLP